MGAVGVVGYGNFHSQELCGNAVPKMTLDPSCNDDVKFGSPLKEGRSTLHTIIFD
jgi:hypothetical protein